MPRHLERMIYIDDSGHPPSGLAVYGWIEFNPNNWQSALRSWLDMRKMLWREFHVAVPQELHTTAFVNGRGRIAKRVPDRHVHNNIEHWKDFGREVAAKCLEALRSTEGLRIGAVYRPGPPKEIATTRRELYGALINQLETELALSDSLGLIVMDGDGTDGSYRSAHRQLKLADRRIIEDAIHLDSKSSQLVQMADLVAWTAMASIDRHSHNTFAWDWYRDYLSVRDPKPEPQLLV